MKGWINFPVGNLVQQTVQVQLAMSARVYNASEWRKMYGKSV